jgi:hypothetical protein
MPTCSKWHLSFRFLYRNTACISLRCHSCYKTHPIRRPHLTSTIFKKVPIMKPHVTPFLHPPESQIQSSGNIT